METQNKHTGWGISFIEQTDKYGKIKISYTVDQMTSPCSENT